MQALSILVFLSSFCVCTIAKRQYLEDSVFESNFCGVVCNPKINHTMCEKEKPEPCEYFKLITFEKGGETEPLMRLIVEGHNGLRSRVAYKMGIPNMLELTWDKNLANMAKNYLQLCPEKAADPCTQFIETVREEVVLLQFYRRNYSYPNIVQNVLSQKGTNYPYRFIERTVRAWYYEKEGMREPIITSMDGTWVGLLNGENNFTHLANPLSFRFGCAMASYSGSYYLVCNYFPYFRTSTNNMVFSTGVPTSACPARFPMKDEMFDSLCTADKDSYFDDYDSGPYVNAPAFFFLYYTIISVNL